MQQSNDYRAASVIIGLVLLVLVPGVLTGPALFGHVSFEALPSWAMLVSVASALLGAWHIATSIWALDEDLQFITCYPQAQEAAVLFLPFVLIVGTRSMYRRLFLPAHVARQRWEKRREQRKQVGTKYRVSVSDHDFAHTVPLESNGSPSITTR